jgi:hypothetical protein
MFHLIVGFDVFLVIFDTFDYQVEVPSLIAYAIMGYVIIAVFLILGNILICGGTKFEFFYDKVNVHSSDFIIIKTNDISYNNVVKVTYAEGGWFNQLFKLGKITLELSGLQKGKLEMENIDNVQQMTEYIQTIIDRFKSVKQAEFTESYKIGNIMSEESYYEK